MVLCFVFECRNGGAPSPSLGCPEGQTQKVLGISSLAASSHLCMENHMPLALEQNHGIMEYPRLEGTQGSGCWEAAVDPVPVI